MKMLSKFTTTLIVSSFSLIANSTNAVEQLNNGADSSTIYTPNGDVAVLYAEQEELRQQSGFWQGSQLFSTPEERLEVEPVEWVDDAPLGYTFDTVQPMLDEFVDPSGFASGGEAAPNANEKARNSFPGAWDAIEEIEAQESLQESEGGGVQDLQLNYPYEENTTDNTFLDDTLDTNFDGTHGVFTRYGGNSNAAMWKSAPWNKIGKLYFTTPSGNRSYCTANVVSGNSIISTAAHCVYSRGQGWNRNFTFVPAERYGIAPYGTFSWSTATVPSEWITAGGRRWDVGLIKLRNNSLNIPVTSYVGWLGRSWNFGYTQNLHSLGYASNISTQVTNICSAQSFYSALEGTDVLAKGCDMTYGSSGGGWLKNYKPYSNGYNYVNGVVSGPHIGAFGTTYVGPRFSSTNIVPLCNLLGC